MNLKDLYDAVDNAILDNPGDTAQEVSNSMALMAACESIRTMEQAQGLLRNAIKQARMASNLAVMSGFGSLPKQAMCNTLQDTYQLMLDEMQLQEQEVYKQLGTPAEGFTSEDD